MVKILNLHKKLNIYLLIDVLLVIIYKSNYLNIES
jgi:hypothetical protein